jgi:putative aminopeptidase FrvX
MRRLRRRGQLGHGGLHGRRVKGTGGGPLLAVVGHIDEIGLIVHHIDDDGYLWFTGVGGWDPVVLVGQRVDVATRDGTVPASSARSRST